MNIKIIATIGPSSSNYNILKRMKEEGMDIARINTKYGTLKEHSKITDSILKIKGCKILYDIEGLKLIPWLKNRNFDYIALSFSESAKQLKKIRKLFHPRIIKIIAKIESKKGIKNINQIIKECDGLMVARGDLGKNIEYEELPIYQKILIKKCKNKKKFVITATEMLLSMVNSKIPERSEVSDVANAILDGSSALMLSEETAIGKHPIKVVKVMRKIIAETFENKKLLNKYS